ncbi:MAG: cytochrome-c peroxidase [Gemmatimonadaceae bacterium]|nr:cytochrome-c peroxidase [Gemmatimonadaceae bacterium]
MRRSMKLSLFLVVSVFLASCADQPTQPPAFAAPAAPAMSASDNRSTAALVRQLAASRGITALPHRPRVRESLVRLGQALAFDKVLSGNRDISCMTCHLPTLATGDGRSLSIGQGATGVGGERRHPQGIFIPRNAPPLFNLGAMRHLFWDGRIQRDASGRVVTPADADVTPAMQRTFEFGSVSAIGMFPVTNRAEMRADGGNELAAIPDDQNPRIWAALMRRLGAIPEYREMFEDAYPGERFSRMTFAHASNAIAGFLLDELSFDGSPWDRFLDGRDNALNREQLQGAQTFLSLKCSICHNGPTFSDEQFHNVAVAQFGPGKGNGPSGRDDFGRMNVTGLAADQYLFRTTPLRNVELTGPYGHDGALSSLRSFVEHYSESDRKLRAYDPSQLEPLLRGTLLPNADAILATRDTLLNGVVLTDELVGQLMAYMSALTDPAARDLRRIPPRHVPSRLPVDGAR